MALLSENSILREVVTLEGHVHSLGIHTELMHFTFLILFSDFWKGNTRASGKDFAELWDFEQMSNDIDFRNFYNVLSFSILSISWLWS